MRSMSGGCRVDVGWMWGGCRVNVGGCQIRGTQGTKKLLLAEDGTVYKVKR